MLIWWTNFCQAHTHTHSAHCSAIFAAGGVQDFLLQILFCVNSFYLCYLGYACCLTLNCCYVFRWIHCYRCCSVSPLVLFVLSFFLHRQQLLCISIRVFSLWFQEWELRDFLCQYFVPSYTKWLCHAYSLLSVPLDEERVSENFNEGIPWLHIKVIHSKHVLGNDDNRREANKRSKNYNQEESIVLKSSFSLRRKERTKKRFICHLFRSRMCRNRVSYILCVQKGQDTTFSWWQKKVLKLRIGRRGTYWKNSRNKLRKPNASKLWKRRETGNIERQQLRISKRIQKQSRLT